MENEGMVITVSRQMGSGGTYIGVEAAKALGFSYVDREILHRAADRLKHDEKSLGEMEEGSSGFIENLFRTFALGSPESYTPTEQPVYDRDLFNLESRIIGEIVKEHNAVVMGRGGFSVLRDRPRTIHLFVHAPRDYRMKRLMEADGARSGGSPDQDRRVGPEKDKVHQGHGRSGVDRCAQLSSVHRPERGRPGRCVPDSDRLRKSSPGAVRSSVCGCVFVLWDGRRMSEIAIPAP